MRVKGYSPVQGGDNFGDCGWVNLWLKNQTKLTVSFEFHKIMKYLNVFFCLSKFRIKKLSVTGLSKLNFKFLPKQIQSS